MLSRWKLMAGILGVSLGGLAAASSQCPKWDRSKGRTEETPVAKAEEKVAPAGAPSAPTIPLPEPTPTAPPITPVPPQLTPAGSTPPAPPILPVPASIPPVSSSSPVVPLPEVPPTPPLPATPPVPAKPPAAIGSMIPKPEAPALPPAPKGDLVPPPIDTTSAPKPVGALSSLQIPAEAKPTAPPVAMPPVPGGKGFLPDGTIIDYGSNTQATPVVPTPAPTPPIVKASAAVPPPPAPVEQPMPIGEAPVAKPQAAAPVVASPFRVILRVGEGEPTFEVKNGDNLILKVACEKVDIKSPEKGTGLSEVIARGKVRFAGFGAEGVCDELKFVTGTGEVSMSGEVKVQVKDKLGRVESELTTASMRYKLDTSLIGGQIKP